MFSKIARLEFSQTVPASIECCWEFFASPANLPLITPPRLQLKVIEGLDEARVYPGMILSYLVRPTLGIAMRWTTEITHVREPVLFVDEQRFGPYKFWHHQHHFRVDGHRTHMRDVIHYLVGFGPIGRLLDACMVRRQLSAVFAYRSKRVEEIFECPPR